MDWNNFSDEFEVNEQDLVVIDQLNQSVVPESSAPSFRTAKNKRILVPCNQQSTLPKHFTSKPPVTVSFKGLENEPPLKKSKNSEVETYTSRPSLQCLLNQEIHNNTDVNSSDQAIQKSTDVNSSDQVKQQKTDVNSSDQETQNNNDAAFNKNSHTKYENCVFHGNIINNFHCSCTDYKKSEKKN